MPSLRAAENITFGIVENAIMSTTSNASKLGQKLLPNIRPFVVFLHFQNGNARAVRLSVTSQKEPVGVAKILWAFHIFQPEDQMHVLRPAAKPAFVRMVKKSFASSFATQDRATYRVLPVVAEDHLSQNCQHAGIDSGPEFMNEKEDRPEVFFSCLQSWL
jgi:hypothetical protein